jgi:replicative DNA helicase
VSVAEIMPRGEEFERTPPHDLAAEQCVLGGMLLSKDAISDVLDVISGQDYYRPAHQIVHDVVLDLYSRGEPVDAVTVAAELTRVGDIGRMGGAPYLHTLIASVPTAANAGYYARIVRERSILRRLVEVGTRIVQLGYTGDGDADELVDRAQAEVYGVTERRVSEDYLRLSEIMPGALEEIEAIGSRGGSLSGVPTGFADLDSITNGLHPGQMIVIAARPAMGKALALDTPLPTPSGWTTMGRVAVGDRLIGADGRPVKVVAATGVLAGRPCYEIVFDDQTAIVADANHQWAVHVAGRRPLALAVAAGESRSARSVGSAALAGVGTAPVGTVPAAERDTLRAGWDGGLADDAWLPDPASEESVLTTREIAEVLHAGDAVVVSVPVAGALDLPYAGLPVPPYVFGVCLGEIGHGRIPAQYLRASREQRAALLAGMLDAGGAITPAGAVQFSPGSERLAADMRELIASLGYRCGGSRPGAGSRSRQAGRALQIAATAPVITFSTSEEVFRDPRKRALHARWRPATVARDGGQRAIIEIREVVSVPVRCVQVDAPDSLYLAGESMIPTHNSALALDIARAAAVKAGLASVLFSLEMSRNEITMRLLSAEARVSLQSMRTGKLEQEDWNRLAMRMSEVVDAPLFIDDSPNMAMPEIRSKCRRLKQRHDLRLVIVDYLQLMSSPKKVENRQQEVSELSRSLKLLAKELNVPVVALAQLNRGPELRSDKRPLLADLRESGSIEQDSDVVILLHREDFYEPESPRAGEADLIVAKHRNGPTTTVTVAFQGHYSRFVDMAPIGAINGG